MRSTILCAACLVGCSNPAPPAADVALPPPVASAVSAPVRAARSRAVPPPKRPAPVGEPVPLPPAPERAMRLYAKHCAVCHGDSGLGDGPAAAHLVPRPWSFAGGLLKWGGTTTGSAADADILRVLRRGVPGTAMPSHAELSDDDAGELVAAVRHLALASTVARIREADPERSGAEVLLCAQDLVAPGGPVTIPPRPDGPSAAAATSPPAGYQRRCGECHGDDARGGGCEAVNQKDAMGFPISPRDLTRDVLSGGDSERDIATRLARGIPGTPMPAANLPADAFWEVVDYVRRLRSGIDADAAVQRRATISARRAAGLPASPSDPAWTAAPATRIPLMPLRRDSSVPAAAELRAISDGRRVAVRVEWRGRGDAAAGAAVRVMSGADDASPFGSAAPGAVARWSAAAGFTPAASPPAYVPLSEISATAATGGGAGARVEGGWAVVLDVGLPEAAKLDLVVGVWDGVAADGRLLEATTIRHALDVAR